MNVYRLPHGHHQPFYKVLVDDGSCGYAAQENLEYNVEPQEISHSDVGHYFLEFTGTHYIPIQYSHSRVSQKNPKKSQLNGLPKAGTGQFEQTNK